MASTSSSAHQFARNLALALAAVLTVAALAYSKLASTSPASSVMTTQQFFYLLGHLSFAATFLAYAQHSLMRLRLIASLGLALGLVYNGYVHMNMPEGQNMFPSLFWLSIFLVQNVSKSIREALAPARRIVLSAEADALRKASFPSMSEPDWDVLAALAEKSKFTAGACLLLGGEPHSSLQVLVSGEASEIESESHKAIRHAQGALWGGLPWAVGAEAVNSAQRTVTATTPSAEVWSWSYAALDKLAKQNASLATALKDGILRSTCLDLGLLKPACQA